MGGAGLYSNAVDFMKLLTSLLRNDGKVLGKEMVDLMFETRLEDRSMLEPEKAKEFFENSREDGVAYDHCLCGLVNLGKLERSGRQKGAIGWGGATRCYWVSIFPLVFFFFFFLFW